MAPDNMDNTDNMSSNLEKLSNLVRSKNLSGIVLINTSLNSLSPNIYYFIGKTFEHCVLLIAKDRKKLESMLLIPRLEYGRAIEAVKGKGMRLKIIGQKDFVEMLKSLNVKGRIGIDFEFTSLSESKKLKSLGRFVDISADLKNLRMTKSGLEIRNVEAAARYAEDIMKRLLERLSNNHRTGQFRKESDIMRFLDDETRRLGLTTSFKPIVASGRNSANPHHDSTGLLARGFCIIDFGVRYKGYCSDITRTVYFGTPNNFEKKTYDLVLKANIVSISQCRPGKKCADIDRHCRKILGRYERNFIHGLGHGLGVEIHERPIINKKSKDVLRENMVFTIEPGIYLKGRFGIRIEDDVVLRDKPAVLTKMSKELRCFTL